jgi:23S rRNA (cytidine1920-2'-O)/16S rRNA (cytidine1409-2'-O)-methyltransferase
LQHGAVSIVAVDVGHNQIDWRIRQDTRVEVREGVNARYLQPHDFSTLFDLIVVDVSFISLTKVMPALMPLMKDDAKLITLIKPQFEVGKGEVGSGGVVKNPAQHERVVQEISEFARTIGLIPQQVMQSPIQGAEGNIEFLALFKLPLTL